MTARLRATLLAGALFVVLTAILLLQPTGYSLISPGPTLNVLGNGGGSSPIITITGHASHSDNGELRMVTVYEMQEGQSLSLGSMVQNWLGDDTSVYPSDFLFPPGSTNAENNRAGVAEMTSAQDLAKAAALHQAGIAFTTINQAVIASVSSGGPSAGKLQPGDVVVSVGGKAISTPAQVVAAVHAFAPGAVIPVVVQRSGKQVAVSIKAGAAGTSGTAAKTALIGISIGSNTVFKFPFQININIPDNITGPSAGMIFALTIYDKIVGGDLTKGHVIAGTGTIDADGNVGAIGGIDQKIRGAERDGAQLFLAPASNCNEVVRANYDHAKMRIVKVNTLTDAINEINAWTANPDVSLPSCQ